MMNYIIKIIQYIFSLLNIFLISNLIFFIFIFPFFSFLFIILLYNYSISTIFLIKLLQYNIYAYKYNKMDI